MVVGRCCTGVSVCCHIGQVLRQVWFLLYRCVSVSSYRAGAKAGVDVVVVQVCKGVIYEVS